MQDTTTSNEIRIRCTGCGDSLQPSQQFCSQCGARTNVRIEESGAGLIVDVSEVEVGNLPVIYEPRGIALNLANDADPTQAVMSLLPYVLPEAKPAISEALISREKDLRSKARKADTASTVAGTVGASVGASVFSGAAVAAASAPISIPIVVVGAVGLLAFGFGMMIHIEAKGERDDYNDHANTLASARRRFMDGQ